MSDGAQDLVPVVARYMVENESLRRALSAALAKGREEAREVWRQTFDRERRECLLNERQILENGFGRGAFVDGCIRQRLGDIDKELRALSPSSPGGATVTDRGRAKALPIDDGLDPVPSSPGEPAGSGWPSEELVLAVAKAIEPSTFSLPKVNLYKGDYERAMGRARDALSVVANWPLPAPPHERSEGEPTEQPGAVDPYTKGLHAGREEMRERAAQHLKWRGKVYRQTAVETVGDDAMVELLNAKADTCENIAEQIEALPLQAEGEDTPHG